MTAHLLWADEDLYQSRYEKSASALIAIKMAIERNPAIRDCGREFLELFEAASATDPESFTQVWRDPTAYFWVRLAYEFVGNCLTPAALSSLGEACSKAYGASDSPSALAAHLRDFKRFALALAILSNRDQNFREPLEIALPFAIPGTRFVLSGNGKAQIAGFTNGSLEILWQGKTVRLALRADSRDTDSLSLRTCPVAAMEDYRLLLQPEAFNLVGLEIGRPLQHLAPAFQSEQVELTEQALALIHRHSPHVFEHFRAIIRLIALKPNNVGDFSNVSHSDLPGSFICTVVREPYSMADGFIHEFHHNRLFFIEERGAFFARRADNLMTDKEYYSPWRDDLRPLHGIFHGLYVYIAVWRFQFAVYESGETSGLRLDAVRDQIARVAMQLTIAIAQLRRFAEFTSFGAGLFEAMAEEVSRIRQATAGLKLPDDLPAMECSSAGVFSQLCDSENGRALTSREAVLRHAGKFDVHRQCADLDSIVRAAVIR